MVLSIVSLALITVFNYEELAAGSHLARAVCLYACFFWGIRLSLQAILDVKQHLSTWWLRGGYNLLTVMFGYFTLVYAWAAIHPS